jgi:hypothetical protein
MFQRQEYADVARTRVQRTDEGDHEQGPELRLTGESEPGGYHQDRGGKQQLPVPETVSPASDSDGRGGGSQQGGCAEYAHFPGAETESQQIGGKQHGNIAIDERTQSARDKQQPRLT